MNINQSEQEGLPEIGVLIFAVNIFEKKNFGEVHFLIKLQANFEFTF